MSRSSTLRSPAAALAVGAVLCTVLGFAISAPGYTDDRSLLRFSNSKPYLWILFDTSQSMNLQIGAGDKALIGGGDNPNSRLYAGKQALFNVFADVDDVFFGFASFNQDGARVRTKHFVYYNPELLPAGWPITYPAQDANGLTLFQDRLNLTGADVLPPLGTPDDTDGIPETVVADIQGDALTFGPMFDQDGNPATPPETTPPGNSCATPLPLGNTGDLARLKVDSLPMGNTAAQLEPTTLWLSTTGPARTWRLQVTVPAVREGGILPNNTLGQDDLTVKYEIQQVSSCPGTFTADVYPVYQPRLRLDNHFQQTVMVNDAPPNDGGGNAPDEATSILWPGFSDASATAGCNSTKPFSGKGWEGNYDSDDAPPAGITLTAGFPRDDDRFCADPTDATTCVEIKPVRHTTYSTLGRPIDVGDVLPFDWTTSQKDRFLRRLAPNYGVDTPEEFGVASLLQESVTATGLLEPRLSGRAPLLGIGNTPLGKAILDFRCWYLGTNGQAGNKCSAAATSAAGWAEVACTFDSEYGCRRPYLIIISDGDDNCPGENPAADTAAMHSHSGIKTWAINLGDPKNCKAGSPLKTTTQNGKGECVDVSSPEELLSTIQNILGKIREESRTFASAAVPSVQAIAKQALYLTDFTPLNNRSRWPGHLNAFLKPLPIAAGKPDTSVKCTATRNEECFVWDAAEVLANTQTQRNVFYAQQSKPGLWAPNRQTLAPKVDPGVGNPDGERYDLWRGFGLIASDVADDSLTPPQEAALQLEANAIITTTLARQSRGGTCDPTLELCEYKLGDIFHSDPLVFGASFNTSFLRTNAGGQHNDDGNERCTANGEADPENFDRGYRCFATRHGFRRQVVYVGSNDGQMHAFNAAQFRTATQRYDNGTGNELFAYMPRAVMPTVKTIAQGQVHHFTVDGPVHASDVFIDPVDDESAGTTFPDPDDRLWRTVAVAGLREGGRGYYALDITQPDVITGPVGGPFTPDYGTEGVNHLPTCIQAYDADTCGPVPYGSPLWEFTDNTDNQKFPAAATPPALPYTMDEDGNALPDLAFSWSQPDLARVQICAGTNCTITPNPATAADVRDYFVAIFGGGLDVARKSFDPENAGTFDPDGPGGPKPPYYELEGNWIYMVDVETGEVLYKRQLCSPYLTNTNNPGNPCVPAGSVPASIAAVDSDLNGFVDRLYVGTTGGYMFRVDLQTVTDDGSGNKQIKVPALEPEIVNALDGNGNPAAVTVERIPATDSDGNPVWRPYVIFDANHDGAVASALPRPMYFAPAVVIYQEAGGYALAFGTGDREDLWNTTSQPGRFYAFMEDSGDPSALPPTIACPTLAPGAICPRTEADFQAVALDPSFTKVNYLRDRAIGQRGWFLTLPTDERVITDTFSFVGLTFFSSYQPAVCLTDANGNPLPGGCVRGCGNKQYESNTTASCSKSGVSSIFLVATTNGNGLLTVPGGGGVADTGNRTMEVHSFVTNPFTDMTTGNTGSNDDCASPPCDPLPPPPPPAPIPQDIVELFPKNCRFANARIDITLLTAETNVIRPASVPVCLIGHSWKEF